MASIIMEFIAKNPPSLLILGAILLYILEKTDIANILLVAGIFLQVLWLLTFSRR